MNMTEQQPFGKSVIQTFVKSIIESKGKPKTLLINTSDFNLFADLANSDLTQVSRADEIPNNVKFDVVLGDLPLGLNQNEWQDTINNRIIKAQQNWLDILKSLFSLEDKGLAIFLVEPHGLSNYQGQKFQREMNAIGFYVNGVFNTPEKLLFPTTAIRPTLISISKEEHPKLYLAELVETDQAEQVAHNFLSSVETGNLTGGTLIANGDFVGFHRLKIQQQIERLETQYKEYDNYTLSDIAAEINSVKSGETFEEKANAVYIPRIGNSKVVSNLQDAKLKHHNYFQIVLKENTSNEYVASFFESTLGRLVLDSLSMQSFIPHVNKRDIEQAPIAVPSIVEQKSIVLTQHKLRELKDVIENFNREIALNPTSSASIQGQLSRMLEAMAVLTDADKVRAIIREGESQTIEFKESLSLDVKKQTKESYIEQSSLKTIVAFLNTKGGTLLIGVSDDGQICGVGGEIEKFHKTTDKFLLHFKNLMKSKIGEQFYPFIDNRLVKVDDVNVLLVECKASQTPCFLEGKDFYVRTNPATDKLEGPKLVEYVKHRFPS
jgi:hypothetical protein